MKKTIFAIISFLIIWKILYKVILWIADKFPYGWDNLVGVVLVLIGFAISLVLTKKTIEYFGIED
ncbi:MAG: hypothetical protein RR618_00440 [Cellulosilyticaceae bacterium]